MSAEYSPKHPHEPEQAPLILNDGACAVCKASVLEGELRALREAAQEMKPAWSRLSAALDGSFLEIDETGHRPIQEGEEGEADAT